MSRSVVGIGSLLVVFQMCGSSFGQAPQAGAATELRLGDCTIFVESNRTYFIARKGKEHYFGTLAAVVRFEQGERTERAASGALRVAYTEVAGTGAIGLNVRCGTASYLYSQMAEASWAQLPKGKDTTVPICPDAGKDRCPVTLPFPCPDMEPAPAATAAPAKAAAATTTAFHVQLMEGEVVPTDQVFLIMRSELVEEGNAVAMMSRLAENIATARTNFNTFRAGYVIATEKVGDRFQFKGPTRGFRATAPGEVSQWPPIIYTVSRREAMRRARLPEPILPQNECPEMSNLRVYVYPMTMGHDGTNYVTEPAAMAFFVDPKTGTRMTVFLRGNRAYGSISPAPFNITARLYVQDVLQIQVGPFGIATAYTPSIFYAREVRIEHQPFAAGDALEKYMAAMLAARGKLVATNQFVGLAREMSRYTGGGFLGSR